jgi:hypothetical protein
MAQIENHGDDVYGRGFYIAKLNYDIVGLQGIMDSIRSTGRFPYMD